MFGGSDDFACASTYSPFIASYLFCLILGCLVS